ncbi:DNA integrity scanning diadenylate cyclase DisA [Nocardia nova]|uniref:DNA integrity scanning diadenylate cyclase DisA n=1 Tax=Nocardia nova TaxID=37330 RepID=UPI0005700D45
MVRPRGADPAATIARLVPGTELRDGIDRILRAHTGGLIVLGYDERLERICDGGFELDVEFSPTRLRELSKMDGAVVLSTDGTRIRRANVHLVPDHSLPTAESGTRHKAAERTAAQAGFPVVSVSRSTGIVTVYFDGGRHPIQTSETILARANQAMATLERYRSRLDESARQLSLAELNDCATLRDVLAVVHCLELVRRVAREIGSDVDELGVDGRQLALQLAELVGNTDTLRRLLVRDYLRAEPAGDAELEHALDGLDGLLEVDLLELTNLAPPLGFPATIEALDAAVGPRGYRVLAEIPRVPLGRAEPVIAAFGSLSGLVSASAAEIEGVGGIDAELARQIREGLARLAEPGTV